MVCYRTNKQPQNSEVTDNHESIVLVMQETHQVFCDPSGSALQFCLQQTITIRLAKGGPMLATLLLPMLVISAAADEPRAVTVGIYVHQINAVSLHDNSFVADFNIWFRWKGDDQDPLDNFELCNGKIDSREQSIRSSVGDEHYATCRVIATVAQFWDLSAFPLDDHTIELAIEDQREDHKLLYTADAENSALNPKANVPGWSLGSPVAAVLKNRYCTNYGDTSLPTGHASSYSRFVFQVPMKRPGYGYCLKLFVGLLVATLLAFAMFFLKPTDDARFSLGVGAVFATVASEYIVAACLPATNVLTLADALHMLALAIICIAIIGSIVSLTLVRIGRDRLSVRFDRWVFSVLAIAFLISCVGLAGHFCTKSIRPIGSPSHPSAIALQSAG